MGLLKVELHAHTADDPMDRIPYTATELIDRAADLRFDALAITLHERQDEITWLQRYAAERGVVLIRGVERTIEGRHVLLLNFPASAVEIDTFAQLARLRDRHRGLVIAPHPFFPVGPCLREKLTAHADLFDAVELNAMYTRWADFNAAAVRWASRAAKPLVGNGDVHVLRQLGATYSIVEAERHPDAICDAIAEGRVRVETRPLTSAEAAGILARMGLGLLRRGLTPGASLRPARTGT